MKMTLEEEVVGSGRFACVIGGMTLLVGSLVLFSVWMPLAAMGLTDLILFAFGCLYLVASLTAIQIFIALMKRKGHSFEHGIGWLWFVGIFATPITLGILVLALPEAKDDQPLVDSVELPNF